MADLSLEWRDDFQIDPTGDLLLVDGAEQTRQAIIRRLLTAVKGYIWHLEYGAGLPQRIGKVEQPTRIRSICQSQIMLERTVARIPTPTVRVSNDGVDPNLFVIDVTYHDAATGAPLAITFDVPASRS